jgi:hypothetical protein
LKKITHTLGFPIKAREAFTERLIKIAPGGLKNV